MIEPLERSEGNVLGFKLSGKLHDDDYKTFVPAVDAAITQPTTRCGCSPGFTIFTAGTRTRSGTTSNSPPGITARWSGSRWWAIRSGKN